MWTLLGVLIIVSLGVILSVKITIRIIGPDEMAVRVFFGKPVGVCDSGFSVGLFVQKLECYLQRYPKKMYNFTYPECEVITRAGEYKEVIYGALKLKVKAVAYLNFPRDPDPIIDAGTHPLIKILRAKVPADDEGLKQWTDDAVIGALRIAFGQMTWKQAVEDMKSINEEVENVFKNTDGALIKAGFRGPGIKLVVAEIVLPKEIEDALPGPDRARLAADAAKDVAKQESIETAGTLIGMMSETTGLSSNDIQKAIQKSPYRFNKKYGQLIAKNEDLLHRLMALNKNALKDIRVQGTKGGLERMLLNLAVVATSMLKGGGEKEEIGKKNKKEGFSREERMRRLKNFKEKGGKLNLVEEEGEE